MSRAKVANGLLEEGCDEKGGWFPESLPEDCTSQHENNSSQGVSTTNYQML
jgi:hypothetical protein